MESLLKTKDLSGGYGKETILRDISFDVAKGEFLGIIGPNGSGKSTLLRLMSRVLSPQSGEVSFEGKDIFRMKLDQFCKKVAFVPQDTLVNFSFSVQEIVLMGRIPHLGRLQLETKRDFAIAEKALSLTDSTYLKDKGIDQLSAGERQRAVIAKALAQEPVLLFLDEPTSHLDIGHQTQIMDLLRKLNRETSLTIIIVLHDLNLASEYCDRLILLDQGKIFTDGTPEAVLTYQNIESVYKTVVVVKKNSISSRPYVMLVSEEERCRRG
ncbi:MAG: ABC transporter ATP-binding protein [Candidatus Omnitrophica bacterium]|nr:ABC transporter ATP-binding protein [Candidatus Omnitrophota bacterium]